MASRLLLGQPAAGLHGLFHRDGQPRAEQSRDHVGRRRGRKAALAFALGVISGSMCWATVAALGVSAALLAWSKLLVAIKLFGGLYLPGSRSSRGARHGRARRRRRRTQRASSGCRALRAARCCT